MIGCSALSLACNRAANKYEEIIGVSILPIDRVFWIRLLQGASQDNLPKNFGKYAAKTWPIAAVNIGMDIAFDLGFDEIRIQRAQDQPYFNRPHGVPPEKVGEVQQRLVERYNHTAELVGFLEDNQSYYKTLR